MKAEELKPCPFCNKIPELRDYGIGIGSWMIYCICGVLMTAHAKKAHSEPDIHNEIKVNVITAWNQRKGVDEVSREAFDDARIRNGYEHTQYEYSTFDDWLKEQEKEEFCSYHGHSKESIRDNVLDCHAHLAEGRVFACHYKSINEAKEKCVDYELGQKIIQQKEQ